MDKFILIQSNDALPYFTIHFRITTTNNNEADTPFCQLNIKIDNLVVNGTDRSKPQVHGGHDYPVFQRHLTNIYFVKQFAHNLSRDYLSVKFNEDDPFNRRYSQ